MLRKFILTIIFFSLVSISFSQTCIIVVKTSDKMVLAADSKTLFEYLRTTNKRVHETDSFATTCKIESQKGIFFAIAGLANRSNYDLARSCITDGLSIDNIAYEFESKFYNRFTAYMDREQARNPDLYRKDNIDENIVDILFVGYEFGIPKIAEARINTKKVKQGQKIIIDSFVTRDHPLETSYQFMCIGRQEVFQDISPEDKVKQAISMGTEEFLNSFIKRQSEITPNHVGGPVAIIDIFPQYSVWYLNKMNCP